MSTDPIRNALHRARTALRQACIGYDRWLTRQDRPGRRTYQQAGHDALRQIDQAIADLYGARDVLAAALEAHQAQQAAAFVRGLATFPAQDETAPDATEAAPDDERTTS